MGRGQISTNVDDAARALLKRSITTTELRLMPYVQYCLMNNKNLDTRHLNQKEREILTQWRLDQWIGGGASDLRCSKEFWDAMHQILWLGYVVYD